MTRKRNTLNSIWLTRIIVILLLTGVLVILLFSLIRPFNDWSFNLNATLFGQFGDFIGGLIGTVFSLVAALLLYVTLKEQQKSNLMQTNAFTENSFFNLLKTQREIAECIDTSFYEINKEFKESRMNIVGRRFFISAAGELKNIFSAIENDEYLEPNQDPRNREVLLREMEELHESCNPSEIQGVIVEREKLRFTIGFYRISKEQWEKCRELKTPLLITEVYALFFQRYGHVIGHYFRHLFHLIKFVSETNESDSMQIEKRINFIQAQMSSYELVLLFYNAMSFPKIQRLLVKNNFLENLAREDLINISHDCAHGIKLKSRSNLLSTI